MPCPQPSSTPSKQSSHVSQISPPSQALYLPPRPNPKPHRLDPAMARPINLLLPLVFALAAFAPAPAHAALGGGGRGPLVGGWSAIPDVSDPHIQELGGWALGQAKEKRLAGAGLRFRRVVRGEQQVVSGMNYRLYVDAADAGGRSAPYVAVVYEQVWTSTRELTSFNKAPHAH